MKSSNTTSPLETKNPKREKSVWFRILRGFGIALGTIIVVPVVLLAIFLSGDAIVGNNQLAPLRADMEKVRQDFMVPMGGVELTDSFSHREAAPGLVGGFFKCGTVQCPRIERAWYVKIMPGDEERLIRSIMARDGYRVTEVSDLKKCGVNDSNAFGCNIGGMKDLKEMGVRIGPDSPKNAFEDISPKVWRRVDVSIVSSGPEAQNK